MPAPIRWKKIHGTVGNFFTHFKNYEKTVLPAMKKINELEHVMHLSS